MVSAAALYRQGTLIELTTLLAGRVANPTLLLGADAAEQYGIADGDGLLVKLTGSSIKATARVNGHVPAGTAILRGAGPRGFAGPAEITKLANTEE